MKRTSIYLLLLPVAILLGMLVSPTPAYANREAQGSEGVCLPGLVSPYENQECDPTGPAQRLKEYAQIGITFPTQPLAVTTPPAELGNIPFAYAKASNDEIPLYDSVEDALLDKPSGKLPTSYIKYVSLLQKSVTDSGTFYQIANQKWLKAETITKSAIQYFQGFLFKENPSTAFAWVLSEATTRVAPSYSAAETERVYYRYDLVRAYDSQMEGEVEWVMIGPNEWIDHRFISRVQAGTEKPAEVEVDRWIEVNLYEQVMIVHEGDQIVFATLISSGVDPFFTQPGVFQIYKKIQAEYMRGTFEADRSDYYYLEDVPYIMYYDQSRAIHGAYWNSSFGYQRSHGCVNLSVADSHWIYDWANEGDYVYVWDPSGQTPTDPELYGAGGF